HGTALEPTDWPLYIREASALVDQLTYGRLQKGAEVTDPVKMAVCAAIESLFQSDKEAQTVSPGIKSETVGSHSVTYEDAGTITARRRTQAIDAINLYLPPWDPLRYAGV
ncbi:hypothetical protein NIF40_12195, partial [[Clostridium] leptum]|nr:hypothetical protein [[Clostridium] leptum]